MKNTMTPPDGNENGRHSSDGEANHHQLGEEKNDGTELTVPSAEGRPVDKNEPSSAENDTKNREEVTPNQGDIFDDLEALGQPLDEVIPSEKVLTSLPMRKPKRDEATDATSPKSKNSNLAGEKSAHLEISTSDGGVTTRKIVDTTVIDAIDLIVRVGDLYHDVQAFCLLRRELEDRTLRQAKQATAS